MAIRGCIPCTITICILMAMYPKAVSEATNDDPTKPNDYNIIEDPEDIVEEVVKIDKEQFAVEADAREEDVKVMRKIRDTPQGRTHFFDKNINAQNLRQYYNNIVKYQGSPEDIFTHFLMSLLSVKLACMFFTWVKPRWRGRKVQDLEYPVVPLIYFQQSYTESRIRRTSKKSVDSISKFFVIRANEAYIDIGEIKNSAITRQTLTRSPWALCRFLIRMQTVYDSKGRGRLNSYPNS